VILPLPTLKSIKKRQVKEGRKMKMKRKVWFCGLIVCMLVLFWGCVPLPPSPSETRPVITSGFINKEKGRYGDILKIYIEANDPEGTMFRIYTVVEQVGYGRYFPDTIYVEPKDQHHLLGYLQWNTFSIYTTWLPEWTRITIKVSIADTDGNESNTVVFPFEFISEGVPESPLPAPFDQGHVPRLGYIDINLRNPLEMNEP
jgi:hypothetical protein